MTDKYAHDVGEAKTLILAQVLRELREARDATETEHLIRRVSYAIQSELREMETRIMSAVSEFKGKFDAFNARITTSIDGITGDVAFLKAKIEELMQSETISAQDKADLQAISDAMEALGSKAEALDAMTPPTPPAG